MEICLLRHMSASMRWGLSSNIYLGQYACIFSVLQRCNRRGQLSRLGELCQGLRVGGPRKEDERYLYSLTRHSLFFAKSVLVYSGCQRPFYILTVEPWVCLGREPFSSLS
jgi:hypothetical protein